MELGISSDHVGQFFTPPALSELMARLTASDLLARFDKPFLTVQEPACGAGGMILAFTKVLIDHGHNPAEWLWVQCQDVDRMAALMCYLQLSLWNIPGVVIVGNTLALETREVFYTPAHYLGRWDTRLATRRTIEAMRKLIQADDVNTRLAPVLADAYEAPVMAEATATAIEPISRPPAGAQSIPQQYDFGF